MSVTVVQRPYYYSFSKNQVTWRFYIPSPSDVGCKLQFKLYADTASDIPATQRTFSTELRPNSDGYLNVNVQDILDSMIDYQVPVVDADNVLVGQNMKRVTIEYRRISDADPDPAWVTTEAAIYVIKGGIELLKHDYNNYFYNYHSPDKVFATWQPKNRLVGIADEWWMSILFTNDDITAPDLTARKLRVYLEWDDGTNDTVYNAVPDTGLAYLLYHANVGKIVKDAIASLGTGKLLWRFTCQVVGDADVTVLFSEAYTLYADHRVFYDYKIFNYYNSLGGIDHVRILAESEESYSRSYIEADLFANSTTVGAPPDKQYMQANFSRLNNNKTDIGYRYTKAEVLASQEILTAGLIFEIFNNSNKYRLIGLLNKSSKLIKTSDKRWGFSIEWRYPFVEQVYTPEVALGAGYAVCENVAIVGSPVLPAGELGEPYSYSFDITGTAPFSLAGITKPSWMTIAISMYTVVISGTPDVEDDDIVVEFDITNCSAGVASISQTIDVANTPPSLTKISSTSTGGGTTNTELFEVGTPVRVGNSFMLTVYSHTVTVVAVSGDTPTTIAAKLRDAVNGESELDWDSASSAPATGTPGFKPVATASGNQLTIVLNAINSFAASATP